MRCSTKLSRHVARLSASWRCALAVSAGIAPLALFFGTQHVSAASTGINQFMGRWVGEGTLVTSSGAAEIYSCVVTYRPAKSGGGVAQKMRCKNANDKVEASTELEIAGATVSGNWQEMRHNLSGAVSGKLTDRGFDVHLGGRFFAANMSVAGNECAHVMKLVPTKMAKFKHLTATLSKRCQPRAEQIIAAAKRPTVLDRARSSAAAVTTTVAAKPQALVAAAVPVARPPAANIQTPLLPEMAPRFGTSADAAPVRVKTVAIVPKRAANQAVFADKSPTADVVDDLPIIPPVPVRVRQQQPAPGVALNQGQNGFERISLGGWFIPSDAMYAGEAHRNTRFVTR